jgi:hypothetical protein
MAGPGGGRLCARPIAYAWPLLALGLLCLATAWLAPALVQRQLDAGVSAACTRCAACARLLPPATWRSLTPCAALPLPTDPAEHRVAAGLPAGRRQ